MFDFLDSNNIGKEYKGFVLVSIDDLKDYKTKAVYLRHKKTGLEIYHILKDDKENTFAFAFRTLANDSKGCAHIMEHSVLCGSEKFPLKEPFTTLASQSLNTFLNAMTYPDKTVYPGASLIKSDYFTMLDVYADAVFFPKLDYETFCQEGHRLELDNQNNLSIQGVVYNEMKGNYSSFYSVAFSSLISSMFPNSFPAYNSGGDPLEIPELTYEQFLTFHQKFYNPDNCLLFLYGDIPTSEQLDYFNDHFISRIEKKYCCNKEISNINSSVPIINPEIKQLQKINLLDKSQRIITNAPETGTTGSFVVLSWYTGADDMEKYYLSEVLCGNDSSPLTSFLKESELGDDVVCFNFSQYYENVFILGLYGVKKGDEDKVYQLFEKAIEKISKEEISQEDIDGAVMGIDVALRDVNRFLGPYSIPIMEKVLKGWSIGKPCSTQLTPITSFEKVKENIKNDRDYTKKLIRKIFLSDSPKIQFICEPSKDYFSERKKKEDLLIKKFSNGLDKNKLKEDLEKLHKYQQHIETDEELKCIPRTKLSELDCKIEEIKTKLDFVNGFDSSKIPVLINEEDTNGIFYLDVFFPYDTLEEKYYKYIPFFTNVITNLGWNGKKWDKCISEVSMIMGDTWGRYINGFVADNPEIQKYVEQFKDYNITGRQYFYITCQALAQKAEQSLEILSQIITTMDFKDTKRLKTLIKELVSEKKNSIIQKGFEYTNTRLRCNSSLGSLLNEIQNGISQFSTVKKYKNTSAKKILKIFKFMYDQCIKSGAVLHLTADKETLEIVKPLLSKFALDSKLTKILPKREININELKKDVYKLNQAETSDLQVIKIPTQTAFSAFITKSSEYLTKQAAAQIILGAWMENHILWEKIRTTGGAYGTSALCDSIINLFSMTSYRDPSPITSVQTFKSIFSELKQMDFSKEEIERTIVTIYGNTICPLSPRIRGEKGFSDFIYGNPQFIREKKLEILFSITPQDMHEAVLIMEKNVEEFNRSVIFCDKSIKTSGKIIKLPL